MQRNLNARITRRLVSLYALCMYVGIFAESCGSNDVCAARLYRVYIIILRCFLIDRAYRATNFLVFVYGAIDDAAGTLKFKLQEKVNIVVQVYMQKQQHRTFQPNAHSRAATYNNRESLGSCTPRGAQPSSIRGAEKRVTCCASAQRERERETPPRDRKQEEVAGKDGPRR